jgi:hypothetical protein
MLITCSGNLESSPDKVVITDNGQLWNIPPHLLSPVKDAGAIEPRYPVSKKKKRLR